MPEVWVRIFKQYVNSFDAITTLANNGLMDEEEKAVYEHNLLKDIIVTFQSELEE